MTTQLVIYWILIISKNKYKSISIDLSKQTKSKDSQQINFIVNLEDLNNGATMFFVIEKSEETTFEFLQNAVNMETQKISNLLNSSENIQNLQQKNGTLLTVNQRVTIHTKIQ